MAKLTEGSGQEDP
jgi:hypothetical protein